MSEPYIFNIVWITLVITFLLFHMVRCFFQYCDKGSQNDESVVVANEIEIEYEDIGNIIDFEHAIVVGQQIQ